MRRRELSNSTIGTILNTATITFTGASVDYANWYCSYHTGSTNGKWKTGKINLKKVLWIRQHVWLQQCLRRFWILQRRLYCSDRAFIDDVAFTVKKQWSRTSC